MFAWRRKSSNSGLSVAEHGVTGLAALGQPLDNSDNTIGPLGLNLLYTPSVPLLDLIFVHGLRGGSRKTWSKTNDPCHFWPKEWLPRDPEFKNVRIHSFGYSSDWADWKDSVLNIHDFGKSLLAEIINSPEIRKDDNTPIVFVGHSMGGLVIKKACILVHQDPSTRSLADRVYSIVFLATPHRGADSATMLNNILLPLSSKKPFISDLERNSGAVQLINDGFRHYSEGLELRSFYETIKTNIGVSSLLIVSKDSATLGYPNEQSALLNATHRSICKFDSPSDPNFVTLRNALVTTTRNITEKATAIRHKRHCSQLRNLQHYLDASDTPEDVLTGLEDVRLEGSCQWFTSKTAYQAWRDCHPGALPHYWLSAQPAAGKSVMAAHVVRNLENSNTYCSYYFFKHNDTAKVSLSGCLRSLAYQMALVNPHVRQRLLAIMEGGVLLDRDNELTVWRKVFLSGIFEVCLDRPHFWVIDALDECNSQNNLLVMLNKVSAGFPLRMFMTSRRTVDMVRSLSQVKNLIHADEMTVKDTHDDIKLYLQVNMRNLMLENQALCRMLTEIILGKSRGSFLWVVLVLKEMQSAFSEADIQQVLEEVPQGMEALYNRALKLMSQTNRGKHLIKAVLLWTVCATRPLTLQELEDALKLDTGESVLALEKFIGSTCGHMVCVDRHDRVSLVHETARTFLLQQDLESEFAVNPFNGHGRIADVCLRYLTSDEMRPPRSQKLMHMYHMKTTKRSPLADYACRHFSQHLRRSHLESAERSMSLSNFLERNVCSWIEHMARTGNVQYLVPTARDLKAFLQSRAKYHSRIGKDVQRIGSWQSDLIRLAAQFGRKLTESPSAIFWLIPPLCPRMTAIGTQFGSTPQGIIVRGLSSMIWSDRTSCINYRDRQTRAIACADTKFAVALSDKSIQFYSNSTCQELQQLKGPQPAKHLVFSSSGKLIAASSVHYVTMFDVSNGENLWERRLPQECLTLMFTDQDKVIWLFTKGRILLSLSVSDGAILSFIALNDPSDDDAEAGFRRIFTSAAFSLELSMVAAVQRGRPISLYNLENGTFLGLCERETDTELDRADFALLWVHDFVFNPNPATTLLAALYHDGNLVLFDPCELAVKAHVEADAQILACSPDGCALATGNATGTIQIFDFECLNLMYRVIASDHSIRSLAFSCDNRRILDIRGSQCNVWEPPILVQMDFDETGSVSDTVAVEPTIVGMTSAEDLPEITALDCHKSGECVFCGKDNGAVSLFSTATGKEIQVLYRHARGIVVNMLNCGGTSNVLASADASSRFMVWKIVKTGDAWDVEGPLLDARIPDYSISQLLLNSDASRLLVSTVGSDTVYDLASGAHNTITFHERTSWKWLSHPRDPSKLIHITAKAAHVHTWNELSERHVSVNMKLALDLSSEMSVKDVAVCSDGCKLSLEFSKSHSQQSTSHILILSSSSFEDPFTEPIKPIQSFLKISANIEHLIGGLGKSLLFLDRQMWVCSLDLERYNGEYYRHCFIPDDWLSAKWNLVLKVTSKGDLVFVKGNEIAVIKRALNTKETITVDNTCE